jgi:hypothetical protein
MTSTVVRLRFPLAPLRRLAHVAAVAATLAVLFGPPPRARAQNAPPAAHAEAAPVAAQVQDDGTPAHEVRGRVEEVLRRYPPALRQVLRHDPQLLSDQSYLAAYPALGDLIRRYPQVARDPRYYFGSPSSDEPRDARSEAVGVWRGMMESLAIFATLALVITGLAWLVRTVLDHRRWLRATRVHVDVQQKLLDRFPSGEDLATFLQTPAGQRLLDASPVMPDAGPRAVTAPINRILWSVQIGVVLIPFGLGLQWVAGRVVEEIAQFLWFSGVMAVTVGIGFVCSAGVAYVLSRRLGLIGAVDVAGRPVPTEPAL